jgi:molybdenum cofactor cytidylyltransferase
MRHDVVGILLAAGEGSRFGGNKLLHVLDSGDPVGTASARALIAAVPESLAVVRPDDDALSQSLCAQGLYVVVNDRAEDGIGTSIARGVEASAGAMGWVVALADMPFIRAATIELVADRLRTGAALVAPVYRGQRGHPIGFSKSFYAELTALRGDRGGRDLLKQHADRLHLLDVDDRGVVVDLDYRGDHEKIQRHA